MLSVVLAMHTSQHAKSCACIQAHVCVDAGSTNLRCCDLRDAEEGLAAELEGWQQRLARSGTAWSRVGPAQVRAGTGSRPHSSQGAEVVAVLVNNIRPSASSQEAAQCFSPGSPLETLALWTSYSTASFMAAVLLVPSTTSSFFAAATALCSLFAYDAPLT